MEFPSTSTVASTNLHRRDSTSWKLPPTSMQVIYLHGMEFGGSWRKLPWKQMEAPPSICFHGSIYTSTYFHGSTMSVYFRGGFQLLTSASICYHLIPYILHPTSTYSHPIPYLLPLRSIDFHLPTCASIDLHDRPCIRPRTLIDFHRRPMTSAGFSKNVSLYPFN